MSRAGVKNPIILLDEIDKMGYDFRGDPSSALLEVLDPEQNATFSDHYVEVDFDLSEVMFVTTANTLDIPPPLMDRLEIVNLSGYTENERINIARDHLIPRQFKENGLENKEAQITESAVRGMIRYYTREAGVRALDRCISKVCRKIVLDIDRTADDSARAKKRRAKTKIAKFAKKNKHRRKCRTRSQTAGVGFVVGQISRSAQTPFRRIGGGRQSRTSHRTRMDGHRRRFAFHRIVQVRRTRKINAPPANSDKYCKNR